MKFSKVMVLICILALAVISPGMVTAAVPNGVSDNKTSDTLAGNTRGNSRATGRLQGLTRLLALTPEQQTAIAPILEDESLKRRELRRDLNQSVGELRAKEKELGDATSAGIRAILTPEQRTLADEIDKQRTERQKPAKRKPDNN